MRQVLLISALVAASASGCATDGIDDTEVERSIVALGTAAICEGNTPAGSTAWQQDQANSLYVDIDTSACGFATTPLYFTSLGGVGYQWRTTGATSIYRRNPGTFRVYVVDDSGPVTPAIANQRQWHINWKAIPIDESASDPCRGRTTPGATGWQQYTSTSLYLDVDTSACGLVTTPRYFTSLGGTSRHAATYGVTSIYRPGPGGFRVFVEAGDVVTPAEANQRSWHVNWYAAPSGTRTPELCVGHTPFGATDWHQYYPRGLYVDVDTSACGWLATPRYFTSLGGTSRHAATTGATSIYLPTATGFRVYVYDNFADITPEEANRRQWHVNWSSAGPAGGP
jgi:hypothetical protein